MPQYLWLATGGKSQFNNRLASLKVSDLLEKNATPEARTAHIDLADCLIQYLEDKNA